jgi:hypothetical protein
MVVTINGMNSGKEMPDTNWSVREKAKLGAPEAITRQTQQEAGSELWDAAQPQGSAWNGADPSRPYMQGG